MKETPTTEELLKRIESLEIQVAELRGFRIVKPKSGKPVNYPAFLKAIEAQVKGDRGAALMEYRKHYRIPNC